MYVYQGKATNEKEIIILLIKEVNAGWDEVARME